MIKKIRMNLTLNPWTIWLGVLAIFMFAGGLTGLYVFWKGLGITNLTDLVPLGLWIAMDLACIALAAGAFSLCTAVYLFGLKRYQPIARTATFVGLIGYTMAMFALILDIGRPERFWKSFVYWNVHSVLWEVTMCVMLYFTVLVMESLPILANFQWLRDKFPRITRMMANTHHYAPVLAIIGLGLSSLHQSSLGAMYGVLKAHPFWFKPEMSVLFMLSAIIGGIATTLFVTMLAARLTNKARVNDLLVERVSQFVSYLLIGYLYFRAWDVLATTYTYDPGRTEGLALITKGSLSFNFWIIEMLLGMIVPLILLLYKPTRVNQFWRMLALFLTAMGVVAFRWEVNLSGFLIVMPYIPGAEIAYTSYTPSLVELVTGAGILAFGLAAISLGIKYLRVVDHRMIEEESVLVPARSGEIVRV